MKVLIIEDEADIRNAILSYLVKDHFICEWADTFLSASDKLLIFTYDIIILDITLPGGSGLSLLRLLKDNKSEAGLIIISAKNALEDKLLGLDLGADDYLTKPFHLAELRSRIHALIRRKTTNNTEVITFHELSINLEHAEAYINNEQIILTKKEYELLFYLVQNQHRVLSKEAIAEHLWGDFMENMPSFDFVYTHIKNLRKKMLQLGCNDYIKTIYGFGYKFTDH